MSRYEWSSMDVIDFAAHCHIHDADDVTYGAVDEEIGVQVYKDIDAYAECYDAAGVDRAVLSQAPFMGIADAERARAANDTLLETIRDRAAFYGLASLPTAAGGEVAAEEFRRCLDRGFNGGAVEAGVGGIDIHREAFEPILEVADQTGAPLFVHPKLDDSIGADVLDDAWLLNAVLGRDVALCASIAAVVHSGVLDRYPNLNLVYHHLGGNISSALGRFHNQYEKFSPEGWLGEDPGEPFKEYPEFEAQLEDRIYVDTSGYYGHPNALSSALGAFPVSQLLFGTDFPFETRTSSDFEEIIGPILDETPRSDAEQILGGNARELLVNAT